MILWFLRHFAFFREMETLSEVQARSVEEEIRSHEHTKLLLISSDERGQSEHARRVSAETVASERREEIERLMSQIREYRDDLRRLTDERIKSLDSLNLKLMEPRALEPTPDLEKYKRDAAVATMHQVVRDTRKKSNEIDMAVINKLHPKFKANPRVTMNETPEVSE